MANGDPEKREPNERSDGEPGDKIHGLSMPNRGTRREHFGVLVRGLDAGGGGSLVELGLRCELVPDLEGDTAKDRGGELVVALPQN